MEEMILIADFGSQYTQLIARKIRELNVYCEIHPFNNLPEIGKNVKGIILSGSSIGVRDEDYSKVDVLKHYGRIPFLGIDFGAQLLAIYAGGKVEQGTFHRYEKTELTAVSIENPLLENINVGSQVWMPHGDTAVSLPESFHTLAYIKDKKVAAFAVKGASAWGVLFHPEAPQFNDGNILLGNFAMSICGCSATWTPDSFINYTVASLTKELRDEKVVLGLSGGVDSTVAAALLHKAIGNNLYCIFVNHGLLRKNEFTDVLHSYNDMGLNIKGVDASEKFYTALKGITDPEQKRKAIGRVFIEVFDEEAHLIEDVKWLGQGTIYPDVIESVSVKGPAATIKSHHNVGGLPDFMKLKVVEPLNTLFKDEVRLVGKALGVKDSILNRHPFPGPGLAIRIPGEVTAQKVKVLQEVDHIFISALKTADLYDEVWQAAAILLPIQTVGVSGNERTYENVVALRAVNSIDAMSAEWSHLPYRFLEKVSNDIITNVKGVNRVVYDISSKPPATIEWE